MFENIKYYIKKMFVVLNMRQELGPVILNNLETVEKVVTAKKALARFGDGELDIINGKKVGFQDAQMELAERLKEILSSRQSFCLIGVPDTIKGFSGLTEESKKFWVSNMYKYRNQWMNFLNKDMEYCSANVTRPYIRFRNKNESKLIFEKLKGIWKNEKLVIVEGEKTRIGVGNDLLNGATSVRRIICPAQNAYDIYDLILKNIKRCANTDELILLALGPTATVLAYDLGKEGYRALDIGHIDIEYEWFLKNVTARVKIDGKYTNEVKSGNEVMIEYDQQYESEIVWNYREHIVNL